MPSSIDSLLMLGSDEVERLLSMDEVIQSQADCFRALSNRTTVLGERVLLPGLEGSISFSYAARVTPASEPVAKFGSVVPGNRARGLPTVSSIVVALDAQTGRPAAIIDGDALTSRRTVAASIVAARTLASPHPRVGVIGLGAQGELHARAAVQNLGASEVKIWSPRPDQVASVQRHLQRLEGASIVSTATSPQEAVAHADLVMLCTSSFEPVLSAGWLAPGAVLLSIGSFAPERREVSREIMASSRLVVDHIPTAMRQCGQIVDAIGSGLVEPSSIIEIGQILNGLTSVRDDRITVYSSVGVGVQDAAVVTELLRRTANIDAPRFGW